MALIVHHLGNSHSHVVLWLLEELDVPYEIVKHQRDRVTSRSPDTLRAVHPAAKAPTIEDHGVVMIESTGILLYLLEAYGGGRLRPVPDTAQAMTFYQWLTFCEGSAKGSLLQLLRLLGTPAEDPARIAAEEAALVPLRLIEAGLQGQETIVADQFTAADIQLTFLEEIVEALGLIARLPAMQAHLERMRKRDGYRRAEEKGGPVGLTSLLKR